MGAPSCISSIHLHQGVPSIAFPRSLDTGETAEYIAYYFEWDRRGVAFPPLPLPNDFQALCLSYELAVADDAARHFELPELPQVIFYAMLLNEAERLGVLYGRTLHIMESALTELRWSTFELWAWINGDRIFEARFREKAKCEKESSDAKRVASSSDDDEQGGAGQEEAASLSDDDKQDVLFQGGIVEGNKRETEGEVPAHALFIMMFPPLHDTREMADFVKESFRQRRRSATCTPRLLLDDYQDLCPCFTLSDTERAALDFEFPEMVQATFYAMLLNNAVELGIVSGFLAVDLKLTLGSLRWTSFEAWLSRTSRNLREARL
ncbi:hypothetical protein Cgig2_009032 [Carnegiea gigantea]|uniref:Uncharacterized protein n=1 Tax=Carnegiea gigantea TaxID=171969 RepID=A0A9Q1KF94_9CARY|nr:hypothetical protein Cgig2_009032 [Carnegiea gigantea]